MIVQPGSGISANLADKAKKTRHPGVALREPVTGNDRRRAYAPLFDLNDKARLSQIYLVIVAMADLDN